MTEIEFEEYVASCFQSTDAKQEALWSKFRIGDFPRYWLDQDAGTIQFRDSAEKPILEVAITPIGSFSTNTKTWMWSWANNSTPPELREKSERLKGLQRITGKDLFVTPQVEVEKHMVDTFTALAVSHLEALGYYRIPMKHLFVCFAIDSVYQVA